MNAPFPVATAAIEMPAWADNLAGRLLISNILADPPIFAPCNRRTIGHYSTGAWKFHGKDAARLRRMHHDAQEAIDAACVAEYQAGVPWDEACKPLHAFYNVEDGDALIHRLINPTRHAAAIDLHRNAMVAGVRL